MRSPERTEDKPEYEKRRGPDRIPLDKDWVLESGLFVDLMTGYAAIKN